jgi:hypothetical protein
MGQRHQIYIRIPNPMKNKEFAKDMKCYDSDGKQFAHAKRFFGSGETSILAFHHQWLYGMTAAAVCYKIMQEAIRSDHPLHIFSKEIANCPDLVHYTRDKDKVDGYKDLVQAILFIQDNLQFAENGARYGIQNAFFTNEECYNEKGEKDFGDCREDFRIGDNNDGIMIIDCITKKYCFMNIGFGDSTVKKLPPLVPVSAGRYVRAYYPTTGKSLGSYTKKEECENDQIKIQKRLENNNKKVEFVIEQFKMFKVLSLKEVAEIFPTVYADEKEKVEK